MMTLPTLSWVAAIKRNSRGLVVGERTRPRAGREEREEILPDTLRRRNRRGAGARATDPGAAG